MPGAESISMGVRLGYPETYHGSDGCRYKWKSRGGWMLQHDLSTTIDDSECVVDSFLSVSDYLILSSHDKIDSLEPH